METETKGTEEAGHLCAAPGRAPGGARKQKELCLEDPWQSPHLQPEGDLREVGPIW